MDTIEVTMDTIAMTRKGKVILGVPFIFFNEE